MKIHQFINVSSIREMFNSKDATRCTKPNRKKIINEKQNSHRVKMFSKETGNNLVIFYCSLK